MKRSPPSHIGQMPIPRRRTATAQELDPDLVDAHRGSRGVGAAAPELGGKLLHREGVVAVEAEVPEQRIVLGCRQGVVPRAGRASRARRSRVRRRSSRRPRRRGRASRRRSETAAASNSSTTSYTDQPAYSRPCTALVTSSSSRVKKPSTAQPARAFGGGAGGGRPLQGRPQIDEVIAPAPAGKRCSPRTSSVAAHGDGSANSAIPDATVRAHEQCRSSSARLSATCSKRRSSAWASAWSPTRSAPARVRAR